MSVDLPAPFSPSSATISPAFDMHADIGQRLRAAELLGHVAHSEQRLAGRCRTGDVVARSGATPCTHPLLAPRRARLAGPSCCGRPV